MTRTGAHILHVFPGFGPGGTQMRTVQLFGMMPADLRHTILAMDGVYDCAQHIPEGVAYATLPAPPNRSFFGMGKFMAELLDTHQPDAVMTYNWGSIEMVLGARKRRFSPLIHHEDGFGPEEAHRFLWRRTWIRRILLRSTTGIAVPSRNLQNLAMKLWKQPAEKVCFLPNGVDLERFHPQSVAERSVVIGHVAHLRPEKNQGLLLAAFAATPSRHLARLRIVGDGGERAGLETLARDLGVGDLVDFVGSVDDTAPVYREMDVFALSSDTEQMPLTVLEAMASGLPIVATDVGDVRAMVHQSNQGLMSPPADARALSLNLERLITDPDTRRRLGEQNRSHCESHYSKDACYQAWIDFYARLLGW
ncbi:MAG: glycosyltransferase family 4 protein [Planctomycetota bacterium]|nr:glycosyltransferase family 4 protein [Planctomycetota bacterium]